MKKLKLFIEVFKDTMAKVSANRLSCSRHIENVKTLIGYIDQKARDLDSAIDTLRGFGHSMRANNSLSSDICKVCGIIKDMCYAEDKDGVREYYYAYQRNSEMCMSEGITGEFRALKRRQEIHCDLMKSHFEKKEYNIVEMQYAKAMSDAKLAFDKIGVVYPFLFIKEQTDKNTNTENDN